MEKTISPSIDILLPSNIERLLYLITQDPKRINIWWDELKTQKKFIIDSDTLNEIKKHFIAGYCDEENCLKTIKQCYDFNYLIDPHTSVALKCLLDISNEKSEYYEDFKSAKLTLLGSTAHCFKFSDAVVNALNNSSSLESNVDEFNKNLKKLVEISEKLKLINESNFIHYDFLEKLQSETVHNVTLDNSDDIVKLELEKLISTIK